jgi:TolB-like protein/Flp pilus assembly protein TadD
MIGTTVSHYRITGKLGSGGMGDVYEAEDTELRRKVALKVLPEHLASDPERLERFKREARAVASLNHPNIVTLHSVEESDGRHFLTMELVDGKSLDALIPDGGFDLERLFELAIPIADALAAAHEKGVVHRDLKPANVMVGEDGRLRIVDFGLAKLWEDSLEDTDTEMATEGLTKEGVAMGTAPYMSPEQLQGREIDHRSDLFSLGILLYEMTTGGRPFRGESSIELASSILKDTPDSVTDVREGVPRHLGRIIKHCLEKDPELRFQSAKDVRNDLAGLKDEVASGEVPLSTGAMPAVSAPEPASKARPSWVVPAVVVAALLLAAGLVWMMRGRQEVGPTDTREADTPIAAEPELEKIVVLPFENLGSEEEAYFAAGISEEITGRLGSVSGLKVISRKSAQRYVGTDKTIQQIGEELDVGYVLDGTVRWARNPDGASRVRITPELIRVADESQLWSNTYDRTIEDIFEVQSDIASQVIGELGVTLLEGEQRAVENRPTENIEAYQAFLRGLEYAGHPDFTERNMRLTVEMFQRATDLDPSFAQAHAWLSQAQSRYYWFGHDLSEARMQLARQSAAQALALDPELPEGHVAMGYVHYYGARDYDNALKEFIQARQVKPNDKEIVAAIGYIRRRQGDWEATAEQFARALELDPQDVQLTLDLGEAYQRLHRYEEADAIFNQAIAIFPDQNRAYSSKAANFWQWKGDPSLTRPILEEMPMQDSQDALFAWWQQELRERDFRQAAERLAVAPYEFLEGNVIQILPKEFLESYTYYLAGDEARSQAAAEEALPHMERYARERPDDAFSHVAYGLTLAALGRHQEAVQEGELAMEILPLEKDAIYAPFLIWWMGTIYVMVGDYEAALDQMEVLLSIPSTHSVATMEGSPLLDKVRDLPRYQQLIEKYR